MGLNSVGLPGHDLLLQGVSANGSETLGESCKCPRHAGHNEKSTVFSLSIDEAKTFMNLRSRRRAMMLCRSKSHLLPYRGCARRDPCTWLSRSKSNRERDGCALGHGFSETHFLMPLRGHRLFEAGPGHMMVLRSGPSDLSTSFTDKHFRSVTSQNNIESASRHFHAIATHVRRTLTHATFRGTCSRTDTHATVMCVYEALTRSVTCLFCSSFVFFSSSVPCTSQRVSVPCELAFSSCLPRVVCARGSQRHRRHEMRSRATAPRVHIAVVAFAVEWRTVVLDQTRGIP